MFSTNVKKICCTFTENKKFEKSTMATKIAQILCNKLLP